jgi:hypothetical protein
MRNLLACLLLILPGMASLLQPAHAQENDTPHISSAHFGLVHPEGVDVAGYSVERKFDGNVYSFYTFGFPSLAAIGFSYYGQYAGNGLTATAGVGVGFVLYGSVAYQFRAGQNDFIKLGAGWGAGVAYSGGYPVLSYEHRFAQ